MAVTLLRGAAVQNPTPTSLGTTNSGGASATTLSLTITAAVAKNDPMMVFCAMSVANAGDEATIAFTDSGGNTWTRDVVKLNTSGSPVTVAIGSGVATTALTSGSSTITVTVTPAGINPTDLLLSAIKMQNANNGLMVPIAKDGTTSLSSATTGTSATTGSFAPTWNPDYGIAAYASKGAAVRTGTPPANWTEMFDFGGGGTVGLHVNRSTNAIQALTALNPAETLSATADWVGSMVYYKETFVTERLSGISLAPSFASTR